MKHTFELRSRLPFPARVVFDWHARPGALQRLVPPWQRVELLEQRGTIRDRDRTTLRLWAASVPITWVAEHTAYIDGLQFRDVQVKGPFASWVHTHRFEPAGENACVMIDHIEYAFRYGQLGRAAAEPTTRDQLERGFAYRHRIVAADLAEHAALAQGRSLTFAVTGATGLIGSALVPFLTTGGHTVRRLVRGTPRAGEARWDPTGPGTDLAALEGVDAVIHLAGENVFGQWTPEKKERIRRSRAEGTRRLAEAVARLNRKPAAFVSASAIGIYGDRGDEPLTEDSPPGQGFLADVAREWEAATRPAEEAGIRVVCPRIAAVLDPRGGAMAKLLPLFKLGLGGAVAGGRHRFAWITTEDVVSVLYRAAVDDRLRGPVNAAAPDPVTNQEFTRTLARVLGRPAFLPVPGFAVSAAFGEELAREVILASLSVQPLRLAQVGHTFRHPALEPALRAILGR